MFKKLLLFLANLLDTDCPKCGAEMKDVTNTYGDVVSTYCRKCGYVEGEE